MVWIGFNLKGSFIINGVWVGLNYFPYLRSNPQETKGEATKLDFKKTIHFNPFTYFWPKEAKYLRTY